MREFATIRCRYCRYLDWLDISDPKEGTKAPRKTSLRIQPQKSQVCFAPLGSFGSFEVAFFCILDSCWLCIDQGLFNQLASLTTSWSRNMDGVIAWNISKVWKKATFHSYVWMQCPSAHWWSLSELGWHTEGYRKICHFFVVEGLEWIGMVHLPWPCKSLYH